MKYRSDIDGLRAVAVISVLLFHLGITLFSGGYIGVDIFFVISGFLITSIITEEIKKDQFSIIRFYERRIRRIFPALFAMMIITTIVAYFLFLPMHFKDYGQSIVAATLFSSNILFWKESGYFSEASETKPLLHTWTLGVEEQFYIFFPLILLVLYRYFKGKFSVWIIALSLISLIISIYGIQIRPTATFFLLPTRAWEFFVGGLLALGTFPKISSQKIASNLALLGGAFIIYSVTTYTESTPFPGLSALLPVIGTFLIIYSGTHHSTIISRFLSVPKIVFIGLISYSLYLWHWPIIVFLKYYFSKELGAYEIVSVIILSFALAFISWKYIEAPFRKKRVLKNNRKLFLTSISVMVVAISLGMFMYISKGYPQRFDPSIRNYIVNNELAKTAWEYPDKYNNFKNALDKPTDMNYYVMGKNIKGKILFWGDSHVGMLFPAIKALFDSNNTEYEVILGTSGGCLPVRNFNRIKSGYFCDRFNAVLYDKAMQDDIDIVVIGSRWDYIGNKLSNEICQKDDCSNLLALETVKEKLKNDISQLIQKGKKVYIILPFPRYNHSVPITLEKQYLFDKTDELLLDHKLYKNYQSLQKIDEILSSIALETGAKLLDPKILLCHNDECTYEKEGISIYRDSGHLNTDGALMMKTMLDQIFTTEHKNE